MQRDGSGMRACSRWPWLGSIEGSLRSNSYISSYLGHTCDLQPAAEPLMKLRHALAAVGEISARDAEREAGGSELEGTMPRDARKGRGRTVTTNYQSGPERLLPSARSRQRSADLRAGVSAGESESWPPISSAEYGQRSRPLQPVCKPAASRAGEAVTASGASPPRSPLCAVTVEVPVISIPIVLFLCGVKKGRGVGCIVFASCFVF